MTDYMTFRGPGFTLETPTDWLIQSSPQYQAMFIAPTDPDSSIRINLLIAIRAVPEGTQPAVVAAETRTTQARDYPDYAVIAEAAVGQGAVRRYAWRHPDSGLHVVQTQAFFIVGQGLFTLTGTRPHAADSAYDAVFDHMIGTFQLALASD